MNGVASGVCCRRRLPSLCVVLLLSVGTDRTLPALGAERLHSASLQSTAVVPMTPRVRRAGAWRGGGPPPRGTWAWQEPSATPTAGCIVRALRRTSGRSVGGLIASGGRHMQWLTPIVLRACTVLFRRPRRGAGTQPGAEQRVAPGTARGYGGRPRPAGELAAELASLPAGLQPAWVGAGNPGVPLHSAPG
jgi:hypothetical protein